MSAGLLFANADSTVFVLDIPALLAGNQRSERQILSFHGPQTPYPTPEPKGRKREVLLAQFSAEDVQYHARIRALITKASLIASASPAWYLPRLEARHIDTVDASYEKAQPEHQVVLSWLPNEFKGPAEIQNRLVTNEGQCTRIAIPNIQFLIPESCAFAWSNIECLSEILADASHSAKLAFDIVLMDPPWTNRSVRHAKSYQTMNHGNDRVFVDACSLATKYCARDGHIAIWITNKCAIRKQVMQDMNKRGFMHVEEWIWVKVTCKGEPVTLLDGVWRKPYEILLIFKQSSCQHGSVERRFMFAVPDLHSRKPSLKHLFESILGSSKVLEMFARNLTTGWLSTGDEVLKFQDSRMWQP